MSPGFVVGDRGLGASGDTHPLWMMAHATMGTYWVAGASAVGQIHLARNLPRDDAFIVRSLGSWMAVAVADGVGSRPFSRYGATYAVEALSSLLLRPFTSFSRATHGDTVVQPSSSAAINLSPPSSVEEVELKQFMAKKGGGAQALGGNLISWSRKILASSPSQTSAESLTSVLQNVGSIGWWTASPRDQQATGKVSPDRVGAIVQKDNSRSADSAQSTIDEHNLVAIMRHAFEKAHLGLREHARGLDLELADLSCTALALLLNLHTGRGVVGQVGDGAILGLTARGKVKELVEPEDTGDPQSTYTLNRPNFQKYLAIASVEPPLANPYLGYYVMTDGLAVDLLFSPQLRALDDWAAKVDHNLRHSASPAQAAAGMLHWLATYQAKGSWDDRTLVVITQTERPHDDSQPASEQSEPASATDN